MKKYFKGILVWANILASVALFIAYLANFASPAKLWPMAFFGLAFPVLYLLNLCFAIIWLFRRNMLVLISLLTLLAGWENAARYFQFNIKKDRQTIENQTIKVLTFNVRLFNHYNWEKGNSIRDSILDYVNAQDADIVCFQDFLTKDSRSGQSLAFIDRKFKNLKYKHINYTYHSNSSSNFGLATYSRYPIVKKGQLEFNRSYNSCTYTDLKLASDTIRVYNIHFESNRLNKKSYYFVDSLVYKLNSQQLDEVKYIWSRLKNAYEKRARQVDLVASHIRLSPYRVIVCGDFNDTPVSYTYQKIRGELEDSFKESGSGIGNTYRGSFPSFRIDYIFHSPGIHSVNYTTHYVKLSDHYPVSCELIMNSEE